MNLFKIKYGFGVEISIFSSFSCLIWYGALIHWWYMYTGTNTYAGQLHIHILMCCAYFSLSVNTALKFFFLFFVTQLAIPSICFVTECQITTLLDHVRINL